VAEIQPPSNPENASQESLGGPSQQPRRESNAYSTLLRRPSPFFRIWTRLLPFFLSGILFLSTLFLIFSPIPLLVLYFRRGRGWALLACLSNLALVFALNGSWSLVYAIFVLGLVIPAAESLKAGRSLEFAAGASMAFVGIVIFGGLVWMAHLAGRSPAAEFIFQVDQAVLYLEKVASTSASVSSSDKEQWRQNLLNEFPSGIGVFSLILTWANLALLMRLNPGGVRTKAGLGPEFIQNWKAPEWLIWPTILCGVFLVWDVGAGSIAALNVFRIIVAIYAIQGVCIVTFFLNAWGVRGLWRGLIFLFLIFAVMPILLVLGFFDLWFDFRAKLRQKS